jgi:hypothetical protein
MSYISSSLRRLVVERAAGCCEYCFLSQEDVAFSFHIEHIIAEKHGGEAQSDNLCLSCPTCNQHKGSDIGSLDRNTGDITQFYNPRFDQWRDHFRFKGVVIEPLTATRRVTVFMLRLNDVERIEERLILYDLHHYPCRAFRESGNTI